MISSWPLLLLPRAVKEGLLRMSNEKKTYPTFYFQPFPPFFVFLQINIRLTNCAEKALEPGRALNRHRRSCHMYRRCSLTGMRSVSRACAAQMCARTHIRMHVLTQAHTYARIVSRSVLPTCATHCNILQHTATHCNTLQHTATHCRQTQE